MHNQNDYLLCIIFVFLAFLINTQNEKDDRDKTEKTVMPNLSWQYLLQSKFANESSALSS